MTGLGGETEDQCNLEMISESFVVTKHMRRKNSSHQ